MKTGITGAPVARASRAIPSVVDAGIPKKSTNTPLRTSRSRAIAIIQFCRSIRSISRPPALLDNAVAVADSRAAYRRVDQWIAQRAMHDREMVAVDRMRELQQFEISVMPRQHEQPAAFAAPLRFVPMFFAFVGGDALDIGAAKLAEVSPFREHPAPTAIHLAQHSEP